MTLDNKIINFDINRNNLFNLTAKQFDTNGARSFTFRLLKDSIPFDLTGLSVKVGGKKPDGKDIFNDCTIKDAKKGIVELELTTQMQVIAGTLNLELLILNGETRLSTIPFEVQIIKSVTDFKKTESSNEFGALNNALDRVKQYTDKIDSKANETDLIVERKRIDSLVSIPEGTPNVAELIDGRVGADGITYDNIGDAIRTQIKDITTTDFQLEYSFEEENGYISWETGCIVKHDAFYYSNYVELQFKTSLIIKNLNYKAQDLAGLAFYDENKEFIKGYQYNKANNFEIEIPNNAAFVRFTINTNFTPKNAVKLCQPIYSLFVKTKEEINKINSNTLNYDRKLDSLLKDIPLVKQLTGVYITSTGTTSTTGGTEWKISQPISVSKSSVVTIYAKGYESNVAVISKYNGSNDFFTPLVISKDEKTKYTFIPNEDMQICICSQNSYDWKLFIYNDVLSDSYKLLKDVTYIPYNIIKNDSYIFYQTGAVVSGVTNLSCSDYVYVRDMKSLIIHNLHYESCDLAGLAFYNENKEFIKGYQYNKDNDLTIEVPLTASYVRFTLNTNLANNTCLFTNITEYLNNTNAIKHILKPVYIKDKYIHYMNGIATSHTIPNLGITDFIEIDIDATTLEIHNLHYESCDLAGLAFYNSDKVYITGYKYNKDNDLILNIPKNTKYVRVTVILSKVDTLSIATSSTIKESIDKLRDQANAINNKIDDDTFDYCQIFHRISGVGDSLMSGELAFYDEEKGKNVYIDCHKYSWLSNLCKNIGATATHYSGGGRTAETWLKDFLSQLKSENPKPSAYYIGLGTNDMSYVALGTIEDCGTDKSTFYSMYSKIIREIQTFNPNAKIFCCSLYYWAENETVKSYCKAIKEMSEKYKCYYLDFVNRFGEEYTDSNLVSCGHFTAPGYVRVAKQMQQLTNEIIKENFKDFNFLGINYKEI